MMKICKYKIENGFHKTEKIVSIKDTYILPEMDILEALQYEVYADGDDKKYAKRKISQIYCTGDCACGGFVTANKI